MIYITNKHVKGLIILKLYLKRWLCNEFPQYFIDLVVIVRKSS